MISLSLTIDRSEQALTEAQESSDTDRQQTFDKSLDFYANLF